MIRLKATLNRDAAASFAALFLLSGGFLPTTAFAAGTATTTLGVSVTISAGCSVSATPVAFPAQTVLASAVNQSGSILVTCTNTTPYTVALDKGGGTGATVTNRLMTGPSAATVGYALYQDAGHSTNWDDTSNTKAGTGNGNQQTLTVFGQIPAQTTPAPGAYADTVNVTVTF